MAKDRRTTFQNEIDKRLRVKYESNKATIYLGIITPVLGLIIAYVAFVLAGQKEYALQFTYEALVGLVVFELLGAVIAYFYNAWYRIPEEIFLEQRRIMEEYLPEELALKVERVPAGTVNIDGVAFKSAALLITSLETKKIVELQAVINFEHFCYSSESQTVSQHGYDTNRLLLWSTDESIEKEIELRPDKLKILVVSRLGRFQTSDGEYVEMAGMLSDRSDVSIDFSKESIFAVTILFQGKLEGEYKFRALRYSDSIYAKPSGQRIRFLEIAEKEYQDIPAELLRRAKKWKNT